MTNVMNSLPVYFYEEFSLKTLVAALVFSFSTLIYSQSRPIEVDVDFTESTFQTSPWVNEFHYVIVVNKANKGREAQTIKVYEYGKLIRETKVSTGRDQFERAGENHAKRDSWTVTPTGYYTPTFLSKNHRSSAYGGIFSGIFGGTKMPFAIFFNGDIALHEAPKGTESMLGKKASGGCVRLPSALAPELFERVEATSGSRIPAFNVDGTIKTDNNGNYAYREKSGYSALIIVKNKTIE